MLPYIICLFLALAFFSCSATATTNTTQATPANGDDVSRLDTSGLYDKAAAASLAGNDYLGELIQRARNQQLSSHPVWTTLIHYKPALFFGQESQIDSPDFFLSQSGKFEPRAELEATLAAFFSTQPVAPTEYEPQCRFPARYSWLKQQLQFDAERLPEASCDLLQQYHEAIDPAGLTVIFPSTHPNSPSSMFGHTLLRVDKKNQSEETRMLAFSINYAAMIPPEQDMFSYTVLGLTGGFSGRFMVLPYYLKLREYGQIENRDLWEYQLNVPPEQIEFLLQHAFELVYSYFDYYFFTENCSYHLLSLLDVLNPQTPMTDEYTGWTIPVETLKTLEQRQLVKDVRFYPSQARIITAQRQQLSFDENTLALKTYHQGIAHTGAEIQTYDQDAQIRMLDLVTEYLRYAKIKYSEKVVSAKLTEEEREVLNYRSQLHQPSPKLNIPPPGPRPDLGHDTTRISLSSGEADNTYYTGLSWRAAYHDILDPSRGFVSNSGVSFMDISIRKQNNRDHAQLQQWTVLDIMSLEPRDEFFKNISWHSTVSWRRSEVNPGYPHNWVFLAEGGTGFTYHLSTDTEDAWYGFIDLGIMKSPLLKKDYGLLPGVSTGLIVEPITGWRVHLHGNYKKEAFEGRYETWQTSLEQSVALARNLSMRLGFSRIMESDNTINKHELSVQFYY